ncbi:MAG: CocE/NonD family hydrolase [Elainella sp.]
MPYSVRPKQTVSMLTRDGVRLDADVYYPDSSSPDSYSPDSSAEFPVLLMRQPYGRAIASTVVYAHPSWYAAQGYIVVVQDVRGRGSSEGEFDLFAHEIADGEDTVNWAASLPQSDGQVGMYGFSYQGMTQLYAAINRPPALKTICPAMVGYDLYQDWAYEGGAFCHQLNLAWALQLASETVRRRGETDAYRTLYAAARSLPITDPVDLHCGLLNLLCPDSHYADWLAHPEPDAYWQRLSPQTHFAAVDLPMLHIGGWYDTHLSGTWRLYKEMAARSAYPQQLWIGPWAHLPWGRKLAGQDYGPDANSPIDQLQIRWFDQLLKGVDTGLLAEPPVCLFEMGLEMGQNRWRKLAELPTAQITYSLVTTGLAAMDEREGQLSPQPHLAESLPDTFVHDPWRPVPSLGGHAGFPAGMAERSAIDCRSDVLTYTSEPLTADLHLAGEVTVEICCAADAPSFDLCAVLSEVKPNGQVYSFTQGYRRVDAPPHQTATHEITLQPTCICIPQGSGLRLSLSAACFPAFAVNPGTGVPVGQGKLLEARVIAISVHGMGQSRLRLTYWS